METATTAGAGVAITTPLWIQTLNPYAQFAVCILGGIWICVQVYYKIRNENRNARSNQTD